MKQKPPALTLIPRQSRLINAAEGFRLEVISGCLWLTRPGDSIDHFLVEGAAMELNEGLVLIQSDKQPEAKNLESAHYRLVPLKSENSSWRRPFTMAWKTRFPVITAFWAKGF
jgi:hypothetical protein